VIDNGNREETKEQSESKQRTKHGTSGGSVYIGNKGRRGKATNKKNPHHDAV